MGKGNSREYQPSELVNKLVEIGLLTEHEAKAYVYFDIMDDPERDAETIFDIPESELSDEIDYAREKIEAAKKTIEVEKAVEKPEERITTLIGAGLLNEGEAKTYVRSERVDDDVLVDTLDASLPAIKENRKRGQEKIDKSYETISFLYDHTGIQKY